MSANKREKAKREAAHAAAKKKRQLEQMLKPKSKKREFKEFQPDETFRRDQDQPTYPSLSTPEFNTSRREKQEYTGTFVKGIMETHKSNLVPVASGDHIIEITRMRRN